MEKIAVFGAGGFGREVACAISVINAVKPTWEFIGFFDDNVDLKGKQISHHGKCLGNSDDLNAYPDDLNIAIAIGNCKVVRKVYEKITNPRIKYPNIIIPSVEMVDKESFKMGKGNIMQKDTYFSCNVQIGDFNVFNGWGGFGHDARVGSFNTFMPHVNVSGGVVIGDDNFFGVGSIILQQIKVGSNVRLGAGSVLMTKPKPGNVYIGNPAVKFDFK